LHGSLNIRCWGKWGERSRRSKCKKQLLSEMKTH
jgi:hypothetical protein